LLWLLAASVAPPFLCLLPWMVVNALASVATAAAVTLLVWIQSQSWFNDRLYTPPYVPKRS
jgi:hypothetical protein